mmetsp:Transcript_11391/g.41687  ORF Transcript_11391/g.41687 Transcript_11391/m.41687 type:complete len:219 (-) Transcript_11391:94-750(-)
MHFHEEFVAMRPQQTRPKRQVNGIVAASMLANLLPVEPEPGLPVDGAKVQHEAGAAIAVHIGGQIEQRAVPAPSNVLGGAGHVLPGQTRLEGEGHQHAGLQRPAERRALCAAAGATAGLELPETVEVEPRTRPHQLRSWILWQHWLRGVHRGSPAGDLVGRSARDSRPRSCLGARLLQGSFAERRGREQQTQQQAAVAARPRRRRLARGAPHEAHVPS